MDYIELGTRQIQTLINLNISKCLDGEATERRLCKHWGCMLSTVISDYVRKSCSKIDHLLTRKLNFNVVLWFHLDTVGTGTTCTVHIHSTSILACMCLACVLHVPLICPRTMLQVSGSNYRICSIRRRGYCLFHRVILCGFYSRAAFIKLCAISKKPKE